MGVRGSKGAAAAVVVAALAAGLVSVAPAAAAGPTAIAADSSGVVYAGFGTGGQIKRYAGTDGAPLTPWGAAGNNPGQLGGVVAIDVAPGDLGNVWILDTNRRVQEFSRSGTFIRGFQLGACAAGITPEPLTRGGLDVTNDEIYVAHPCANEIFRFRRNDFGLNSQGGTAQIPKGVSAQLYATAPVETRRTYVAFPGYSRVGKYQPWFSLDDSGGFNDPFGFKTIPGAPTDVFVDAFGVLFVSETATDRIYQYDSNGNEFRWMCGTGSEVGRCADPSAFDVFEQFSDLSGNVFVADYGNSRIQRMNSFGFTFWAAPASDSGGGGSAPVNTGLPQVQGSPTQGNQVTCSQGSWSNAPSSFSFIWSRNGSPIGGASQAAYTIQAADVGQQLTCTVTATNGAGSGQATSQAVTPVANQSAPVNTGRPVISGAAVQGQTLSCSQGAWQNNPTGFAYEWRRDGSQIAAGQTYTVQAADVAHAITCAVTASNAGGSTTAVSDPVTPTGSNVTGAVGVTINDSALFTNSPGVTLTVHEPAGATQVLISNDGGFGAGAEQRPVSGSDSYTWTLNSSGPERLPKEVYVRFLGTGVDQTQTYSDDIVLDQRPPGAPVASLAGRKLRVRSSDHGGSGLDLLQLAANKAGADPVTLAFERRTKVEKPRRARFVRVVDRAGNYSRWVRIKRK